MAYSKAYFELQLGFAQKVAVITRVALPDTLLEYTSFYKTFRIEGWDFNKDHPVWQDFLGRIHLQTGQELLDTAYSFYLEQVKLKGERDKKQLFGCFSYEYEEKENYIQMHFRNTDESEPGALSKERMKTRMAELKAILTEIKQKYPQVKEVYGFSWLYHIPAYTRLFPPEYVRNSRIVTDWFRSTALWGQFLDSRGELKNDLVVRFQECVNKQNTLEGLKTCFPYTLLEPHAPLECFYRFYGIE